MNLPNAICSARSIPGEPCRRDRRFRCNAEDVIERSVSPNAQIGAGTEIGAFVFVGPNVRIGENCLIESGACLGALPFSKSHHGTAADELEPIIVGDNCRIGSNSVVQYGVERPTFFEEQVWINHSCSIGHDVQVGARTLVGLMSSISGHSTIGRDVRIGPGSTLNNRSVVGERATIGIGSLVLHEIAADATVLGRPAVDRAEYLAEQKHLRSLSGNIRESRPITGGSMQGASIVGRVARRASRSSLGRRVRQAQAEVRTNLNRDR